MIDQEEESDIWEGQEGIASFMQLMHVLMKL